MNERPWQAKVSSIAQRLAAELCACQAVETDAPRLDSLASGALDRCLQDLAGLQLWGEANQLPSAWLWHPNQDCLGLGVLQKRAREKPLGYAGDYLLLDWISREVIDNPSPLGAAFDRYFQRQAAPQAVRRRTHHTAAVVQEFDPMDRPFRWLSIGSGPAVDVLWALQTDKRPERLQIELWDLDPRALDFASDRLRPFLGGIECTARRENLFRIARRPQTILPECDLLTCLGLFDYLRPDDAAAMLRAFWNALRPGGRLLIFNFDPRHASRGYMEWIGNWYLTYRYRDQMHDLAEQAGLPSACVVIGGEPEEVAWRIEARRH